MIKIKIIKEKIIKKNRNFLIKGILPIINIDWSILPDTSTGFHKLLLSTLILSIILLWCFFNIIGYFIILYGINYTNLENRYPRFKRLINYFKNIGATLRK